MKKQLSQDLARAALMLGIVAIGLVILFKSLGLKIVKSSSQNIAGTPPASAAAAPPKGFPSAGQIPFASETGKKTIAVRASEVYRGSISNYAKFQGDVITNGDIKIFPKMSGKIIERKVAVGDQIAIGSLIALVDPSEVGQKYLPNPVESTVAGTVLSIPVHEGDTVTTSTVIATVGDISRLQIDSYVPEKYISNLRIGIAAEITFPSIKGVVFAAKVVEINPVVDPESRTIRVRLRLTKGDSRVLVGMSATVNLAIEKYDNVLIAPRDSVILSADERPYVFVAKSDNTAERRFVTLGVESEAVYEITSGLKPGDFVVTDGKNAVGDGSSISIIASAETSKEGAAR